MSEAGKPVAPSGRYNRRQLLKRGIRWLGTTSALMGGLGIYAFLGERHWLESTSVTVRLLRLPVLFQGIRIVHFSDLHLGFFVDAADLQRICSSIMELQPDLICFTGDLVDEEPQAAEEALPLLAALQAPLGKVAVLGNHDVLAGAGPVAEQLELAGFQVLNNRHVRLERGEATLYVAGVDDVLHGLPDLGQALQGIPADGCVLLLAHEPDFADEAGQYSVDLQLSGHSHGGQVRLPFGGPILTPPKGRRYPDGLRRVAGSPLQVYTNRGTGTTILPIRFFCRPEITLLTLIQ